jgi:hypothetical protein
MQTRSMDSSSFAVQQRYAQTQNTISELLENTDSLEKITPFFDLEANQTESGIVDDPLIHNVYIFQFDVNNPSFDLEEVETYL